MNVKMMSVCLACAGALLAGCGNSREKMLPLPLKRRKRK